jgi:hypothetical protein
MFYNKREIMHVESTITSQAYVFNIMREETRTIITWLAWKRFRKD